MARICLHHNFEQKGITIRKDPNLKNLLFQGKRMSSVVLDVIPEDTYGRYDQQTTRPTVLGSAELSEWRG
jgi:hypothetical protein